LVSEGILSLFGKASKRSRKGVINREMTIVLKSRCGWQQGKYVSRAVDAQKSVLGGFSGASMLALTPAYNASVNAGYYAGLYASVNAGVETDSSRFPDP